MRHPERIPFEKIRNFANNSHQLPTVLLQTYVCTSFTTTQDPKIVVLASDKNSNKYIPDATAIVARWVRFILLNVHRYTARRAACETACHKTGTGGTTTGGTGCP